jgi:hypothetical protein
MPLWWPVHAAGTLAVVDMRTIDFARSDQVAGFVGSRIFAASFHPCVYHFRTRLALDGNRWPKRSFLLIEKSNSAAKNSGHLLLSSTRAYKPSLDLMQATSVFISFRPFPTTLDVSMRHG